METKCTHCNKLYEVDNWKLKAGLAKYCSRECYYKARTGIIKLNMRKREIKNCVVCNREYESGGRAGKRIYFCSRKCQAIGRIHESKTKILTEVQAAYIAAFLDGEGRIIFPKMKRIRRGVRVCFFNTTIELINYLIECIGVGTIVKPKIKNKKHSQAYCYQLYSWNAVNLLKQILPMIHHPEKLRRAKLAIDEYDELLKLSRQ